ncbi:MAG: tetratricopeptide repeat protein [Leptospiraceae bacterium]|nr:tetratricopeptide repeat protein [Leptospiraceae bacterium]MCP5511617.1 tetratricopeptide repeat protein [Leptospiraceae bacterium]
MKLTTLLFAVSFILSGSLFADDEITESYKLEYKRKYAEALTIMESLAKKDPSNYFYQLRAGWVAYIKGEYSKSNAFSEKAILLKPKSAEARISQIRALMALGQFKQVISSCASLLKIDSKSYYARTSQAYAYYATGNFKEAEKQYLSVLEDYPADTEMLIGLGWSYIKQGNKPGSKAVFDQLKDMVPGDERVKSGIKYAEK